MEAVSESSPRSSTLSPPPPLASAATATRTLQRSDRARRIASVRAPARATSEAHRAPVAAGRTAKMVVFDRVLRPAPATASARPAEVVAWALGASVSLAALTSLASAATWALLFPHL